MVHPETRRELSDGEQGLLLARGPGVSSGYFDDEAATADAFSDGWFDTGDLGWRVPQVPGSRLTPSCSVMCVQKHIDSAHVTASLNWCSLQHACAVVGAPAGAVQLLVAVDGGLPPISCVGSGLLARMLTSYAFTETSYKVFPSTRKASVETQQLGILQQNSI